MTDLDTLARSAARELLDVTAPDVPARYAELGRARTRRTAARLVAVAAAVGLAAGAWQLAGSSGDTVEPAPEPTVVSNGTLVALPDSSDSPLAVSTFLGGAPADLPTDVRRWGSVEFTPDGSGLVYSAQSGDVRLWPLDGTAGRVLGPCPYGRCAVSPDLETVAYVSGVRLLLRSVASGEVTVLLDDASAVGRPRWSPDGDRLAYTTPQGITTVAVGGGVPTEIFRRTDPSETVADVAWSPDSSRVAFFDTEHDPERGDYRYTLMTVAADGSDPVRLRAAGHCYCLGRVPPAVTWSPDGSVLAVTTTLGPDDGVYTLRPDGSGWTLVGRGVFSALAWQPVTG